MITTKNISLFVQFGADQDCYYGAVGCRKMLGAKASKAKNIPSDEAVNLTACKGVTYEDGPYSLPFNFS
ncbi:BnaC04g22550D [Brassica napus]|uniref:BnaC04g22550D protein n=1 Tax=Brassica napus TaxID=3708 RepID=A0A078I8P0_BRANA|nr:BnaC04g22550D [Brassica napus]